MALGAAKRRMFKGRLHRVAPHPRISVDDLTPEKWFKKPPNPEMTPLSE